ncbi:MAG: LacI family DNA-binding transcriptional regulator [Bacteroidales bacterium]|nr:LacI family DNA-binding transcriptional regulator [Candidatus Liminaster caballi]
MGEKSKVTIYDLAQKLGTTASTVSRALQDNPRISLKTREAVKQLARELNYIPDPIAHHLRTGKGNVLGIVVPRIDRNFFATIISAFQAVAQKSGYQLIIAQSNENADEEAAAVRALVQKKVDGIAISLSVNSQNVDYPELCSAHNIPIVFFDRTPSDFQNYDTVTNDNFQIGYDAVLQLYKRGCRKIGHFSGPMTQRSYIDRYRGFRKALEDLHLDYHQEWIIPGITEATGYDAALRILQMNERPDGIFSAGDFSAITAMDTFMKKGLSIPRDIAIIGVANEPLDAYLATPLSSFNLHRHQIGEMTASILISRIKGDDDNQELEQPSHIIVKHELILRDSSI